jgi:hypothetical protein
MDLGWVHLYAGVRDNHAKVGDFFYFKLALPNIEMEACLLQGLKDSTNMLTVFFQSVAINQDVVDICGTEDIEPGVKGLINIGLKGIRGVSKSEGHNQRFLESISGHKGRHPLMAVCDPDIIKCRRDVELSEVLSRTQLGERFSDQRERITVLDRNGVEGPVVDTKAESSSRLLSK